MLASLALLLALQAPGVTAAVSPPAASNDAAVEIAGRDAGAVHTPSSKDAWGGVRDPSDPVLSQRVADYDFEATLDPVKHTVSGRERVTWRNRSAVPIRQVWMHLYLNAFEGETSTFAWERKQLGAFRTGVETKKGEYGYVELRKVEQGGKPATWSFQHPDGGPETDRTVVRVDLPEAVPPGGSTTLDIDFFDQLPRVVARTGWFGTYHLVGQWFPKLGVLELPGERGATRPRWNCHEFHLNSEFYADFGNYRAAITVPKGYTFGSTGALTAPPQEGAQGVTYRVAQDDVHDFVFTAWDHFVKTSGKWEDVDIDVLSAGEHLESARIALKATQDSLAYFSSTLGRYPYRHITVVNPPFNATESGGMEYETFFTSEGTANSPTLDMVRYVTVHEFGHGYFMGLLATNEFEEPFLDEGMNELWDTRMQQGEWLQTTAPLLEPFGIRTPKIGWWDYEHLSGTQRFQADPLAETSWHRWSESSYGSIYPRTVLVFHDLERALGGDVFARGMKEYYRRWHHRHPSTADLEEALADVAGPQAALVRDWFEKQVYALAPVDDRVEVVEAKEILPEPGLDAKHAERDREAVQKEIAKTREEFAKAHPQRKPEEPGPFPWRSLVSVRRYAAQVPQTLVVTFDDGSVERVEWPAGERWHRFFFEKPVRVKQAQLDPQRDHLLDIDKLDDGRTREGDGRASRRWTLEANSWAALFYALVGSL